ncbi:3'-5' exonuclease [Limnoglobus roseus]|uniref:Exonuclease n=1 Tax=Limnoglobus roseus TaxID=2598579 RepID=A0A5C1A9J8_9BACT|nr:3'-5' exonuclease [Limnoglobus roseus]QEL14482.1 exonuclease [Limnoglobus roseus]
MTNPMGRFAALDFETADHGRDSACSVGIIVVEGTTVVEKGHFLIRPPRPHILFSYIHGITWAHVQNQPTFGELWPTAAKLLDGVEFIAAHAAAFDRGVLYACCATAGLPRPVHPFYCTVSMARKAWGVKPTKLPNVAQFLGLPLKHHDAESDALACAGIVIAARQQGRPLWGKLNPARY